MYLYICLGPVHCWDEDACILRARQCGTQGQMGSQLTEDAPYMAYIGLAGAGQHLGCRACAC